MPGETVNELLIIDADELEYVEEVAAEHDVSLRRLEQRGFEPVTAIALSIAGAAAAVATVVYLLDRRRGGQVVDLRPGAPRTIYRSQDVLFGLVVVITATGTVSVQVREPRGMFGQVTELITGLVGDMAGSEATVIADLIQGQLSPDAASISTDTDSQG